MKKNVGTIDKIVRISIAVIIAVLYFTNIISGTLAIILLALAGVFIATAFMGFCGLYTIFGFNSCPIKKDDSIIE